MSHSFPLGMDHPCPAATEAPAADGQARERPEEGPPFPSEPCLLAAVFSGQLPPHQPCRRADSLPPACTGSPSPVSPRVTPCSLTRVSRHPHVRFCSCLRSSLCP